MKRWMVVTGLLAVALFAVWAYRTSGQTRAAEQELARIEHAIKKEREAIAVLRAEWAYLNRPERLRNLVEMNFAELQLTHISVDNYGEVAMVPYPAEADLDDLPRVDPADLDQILLDVLDDEAFP